ncbi:MAG: hypothetical protein KAS87_00315 [Candidatus Omnitrophica bacterium]|nr:hypothetical protein [Candidatus Omnitrophota bacterium]
MNLLLFIVILTVSFIVVKIGAIAFELTGLEKSLAKFQALSCFTGTGFTTKEAELITGNPQRRNIASVLMVLGKAGLVTLVATFANSLRANSLVAKINIPFLNLAFPIHLLPWINLIVITLFAYSIYKILTRTKLGKKLTDALKRHIVKKEIIKPVSFEELVVATAGYGISKIEICKDNPIVDKTLVDSNLKKLDILILAVERKEKIITNPPADTKILLGDKLICFGKLGNIRRKLCVIPK